jgi:hypothetical protein
MALTTQLYRGELGRLDAARRQAELGVAAQQRVERLHVRLGRVRAEIVRFGSTPEETGLPRFDTLRLLDEDDNTDGDRGEDGPW